jgi:hypothetical protein
LVDLVTVETTSMATTPPRRRRSSKHFDLGFRSGEAILGGVWLGHRAQSSRLTYLALGGALTGALAAIMTIAAASMWVAMPAVVTFGFCMSTSGIAIQTIIQLAAELHYARPRDEALRPDFSGCPAQGVSRLTALVSFSFTHH